MKKRIKVVCFLSCRYEIDLMGGDPFCPGKAVDCQFAVLGIVLGKSDDSNRKCARERGPIRKPRIGFRQEKWDNARDCPRMARRRSVCPSPVGVQVPSRIAVFPNPQCREYPKRRIGVSPLQPDRFVGASLPGLGP